MINNEGTHDTDKKTNRKFSSEFKLEAIEQVIRHHQPVVDIARALEIDPSQLRRWTRQYKAEMTGITLPGTVALTPEQREIQQLKWNTKFGHLERTITLSSSTKQVTYD